MAVYTRFALVTESWQDSMITHSTIDQNLKIDPSIYQWIVTHCPLFLGSPDENRMATLVELRLTGLLLASTELQSFNHCGQYEVNLHSPKLLCRQSFSFRVSSRIPSGPINWKYLTTNYPTCKELFLKMETDIIIWSAASDWAFPKRITSRPMLGTRRSID